MNKQEQLAIQKKVEAYNMIPSIIWSVVFLFPISVFCYTKMNAKWFYISLSLSLLALFLPKKYFNSLQVSKRVFFYKKTGIGFINNFIQNGTIMNRVIKRKFPGYTSFSKEKMSLKKLFNQTYMFEKFHFILFIFFSETILFALINKDYLWAVFIFIGNIFYNIYPILLQQYIRLRINRFYSKQTNIEDSYFKTKSKE